ncbi:MAG: hypothetical protein QNJ20_12905 [Paracoccaceae bacterium]|nr:hypothetical protein [Paracoccaceae bacterium]
MQMNEHAKLSLRAFAKEPVVKAERTSPEIKIRQSDFIELIETKTAQMESEKAECH